MGSLATPFFSILSTSLKGSQIRPLRGRNWWRILTSMRSMLETHGFLTWLVIVSICYLHVRNLLPKDDQSISQSRNLSPRPVATWLLAYRHLPSLSPQSGGGSLSLIWCFQSPVYWRGSLFRIALFRLGGYLFTHINRLGYQYSFVWW